MIDITFPDGSVKAFEKGVTAYEIAQGISPRLAAEVLAATVVTKDDPTGKGTIYDLDRPINVDASVRLHKWEDDEAKKVFWHSSSHLMAEALEAHTPAILAANQLETEGDIPRDQLLQIPRKRA